MNALNSPFHDALLERLTVGQDALLGGVNALTTDPTLTHAEVDAFTLETGIDAPTGYYEEFADKSIVDTGSHDTYSPIEALLLPTSLGYTALILADDPPDFLGAAGKITKSLDLPQARQAFLTRVHETEAVLEFEAGHPRLAIKAIRRAMGSALKSELPGLEFSTRFQEADLLLASGDYHKALQKLHILWRIQEKGDPERVIDINHTNKASILRMRRDAHAALGQTTAVKATQDIMYERGYAKESGEEHLATEGQSVRYKYWLYCFRDTRTNDITQSLAPIMFRLRHGLGLCSRRIWWLGWLGLLNH